MISKLKQQLKSNPRIKKIALFLIASPFTARPRLWVKWFVNPFIHKKKGITRFYSRLDLFPYNNFVLGRHSFVEDFATINNGVGDVIIGNNSRIGLGCTVIGPVIIGDKVQLAQNIVLSGLNHNYQDVTKSILEQGVSVAPIIIEDDVWIGSNSSIAAGVKIGTHSVVAGGSVVTKSIPSYEVWAGNPAKAIKRYDFDKSEWVVVEKIK